MQNSADEYDNLKDLMDANEILKEKLKMMSKNKQKMNQGGQKPKLTLTSKTKFEGTTNSYSNVKSKIDPENINLQMKTQLEINKMKKEELELKNCSFKPKINPKSGDMVQSGTYIPLHERPLPVKKIEPVKTEEELLAESEVLEEGKVKKKIDPEFYKRQLEWQKRKEEREQNERLQKQLSEHSEILNVPKINKDFSEKVIGDSNHFMDRLKVQEEKSKFKRQVLNEKYNDYSFKPKINSKSQNVQSRVFQMKTSSVEEHGE